ncbi:MAG: 2-amino-4-hydroxy-6-hydroxymethyldihydropteridine diphosphokinase [candidate division WOR-3 bacterium]
MKEVFLSLGSNKGDKLKNILFSLFEIKKYFKIKDFSSIYLTEPWGKAEGGNFLNMVIRGYTELSPYELLVKNQEIEKKFGRIRKRKYEARTLDIDILFYEKLIMKNDKLIIPHPLLHKRNFILIPFSEIAPFFIHPVFNKKIKEFIKNKKGVYKIIDKNSIKGVIDYGNNKIN